MKQKLLQPNCNQLAEKFKYNFNELSIEELNILFLNDNCSLYKRGEIIYDEDNVVKGCYFLYSGVIKIYKTGLEGKEQIIRFAKEGDLISFRSLFSQERACTSAKVIEDATVCFIPTNIINSLIHNNSNFAIELLQITCKELGAANNYITDIAQKTVRERLAEVLIHLVDTFDLTFDGTLKISLTREELANMVGTATESVIRLLSEFKSDKYIELNGRKIRILNKIALSKIGGVYY